ncbi:hypothetical protein QQZ08_004145 [Neonectria magnoliae]|uniref:MYND-type domain-containing protein n=1 Tax=Neonectria magnoliae TaxID=2732573 RepID=A0ABR1I8Z5_9HYPO
MEDHDQIGPGYWRSFCFLGILVSGVLLLIIGRFRDIVGRRYLMIGAQLFAVVGSIVCTCATNVSTVVSGTALTGIAGGAQQLYMLLIQEIVLNKYRIYDQAAIMPGIFPTRGFGPAIARALVEYTELAWGQGTYPWKSAEFISTIIVGGVVLIVFALYNGFHCLNALWPSAITVFFTTDNGTIGLMSLATASVFLAVFSALMSLVDENSQGLGIALTVLGGLGVGWVEAVAILIAGLVVPSEDIGATKGDFASMRAVTGTVALSIYVSIFTDKLTAFLPRDITAAVTKAGLPESSLPDLFTAIGNGTSSAFDSIPRINATILAAVDEGTTGCKNTFQILYLSSLAFGIIAIVSAFFLQDVSHLLTGFVNKKIHTPHLKRTEKDDDITEKAQADVSVGTSIFSNEAADLHLGQIDELARELIIFPEHEDSEAFSLFNKGPEETPRIVRMLETGLLDALVQAIRSRFHDAEYARNDMYALLILSAMHLGVRMKREYITNTQALSYRFLSPFHHLQTQTACNGYKNNGTPWIFENQNQRNIAVRMTGRAPPGVGNGIGHSLDESPHLECRSISCSVCGSNTLMKSCESCDMISYCSHNCWQSDSAWHRFMCKQNKAQTDRAAASGTRTAGGNEVISGRVGESSRVGGGSSLQSNGNTFPLLQSNNVGSGRAGGGGNYRRHTRHSSNVVSMRAGGYPTLQSRSANNVPSLGNNVVLSGPRGEGSRVNDAPAQQPGAPGSQPVPRRNETRDEENARLIRNARLAVGVYQRKYQWRRRYLHNIPEEDEDEDDEPDQPSSTETQQDEEDDPEDRFAHFLRLNFQADDGVRYHDFSLPRRGSVRANQPEQITVLEALRGSEEPRPEPRVSQLTTSETKSSDVKSEEVRPEARSLENAPKASRSEDDDTDDEDEHRANTL